MTAATFGVAVANTYANTNQRGSLSLQPNGAIGVATAVVLPTVGNTAIGYDVNYAYLTTTQGAPSTAGAVVGGATTNGICYSSPAFNGFLENFGSANANTTPVVFNWATPFLTAAGPASIQLVANATVTNVWPTLANATAFTLNCNTVANSLVYV